MALVPSRSRCLELMEHHGMLPHIREHCLVVAEVALWLGIALERAGVSLDLALIEAGALLHDLGKTPCLGTSRDHADYGAGLVLQAGYPEVARIIREHVVLRPDGHDPRLIREAEVVNYADKRVLHTRVVTLEERFADLMVRYGKTLEAQARLRFLEHKAKELEGKLFERLPFLPADLLRFPEVKF